MFRTAAHRSPSLFVPSPNYGYRSEYADPRRVPSASARSRNADGATIAVDSELLLSTLMRIPNVAATDDRYRGIIIPIGPRTCVLDPLGVRTHRSTKIVVDSATLTFHLSRATHNACTLHAVVCKIKWNPCPWN